MSDPYWNHNVHHHPAVLAAVPDGCGTALAAGCGDGLLARKPPARAASVTGVDRSPEMIKLAREQEPAPGGRLVIVGMAANRTGLDWVISACGVPASMLNGGKRGPAGMPMEDVHMSWREIRQAARLLLPGCDWRRTLLWRYVVVWDKPREGGS